MARDAHRIGVGIALPSSGPFASAENILQVAKQAEACGFDDVWVNDHYSYPHQRLTRSSAGSIEAVTGNRLTVAPGIGGSREDFEPAGVPFEKRGRLLDEHLAVLDAITHTAH